MACHVGLLYDLKVLVLSRTSWRVLVTCLRAKSNKTSWVHSVSLRHHRNVIETSPRHQQSITKTRRRSQHDTTETTPRRHRNIIATSQRHQQSVNNKTETSPWHPETSPKQHKTKTDTSRRQDRDMTESMNFSVLKLSPSTYGSQLHWFAQRRTI